MASSPTMLASQDGQRCRTRKPRSGATVMTRVTTRKTGATMLAVDRSPTPTITRPATTRTAKKGGLPARPGPGCGSGLGGVVGAGGWLDAGTELLGSGGQV